MNKVRLDSAFKLSLTGSILTIVNGLWITIINQPIIISTSKVTSLNEIMGTTDFWGRLVLGIPGLIYGPWVYFWMIFPVLMLIFTFITYKNPRRNRVFGLLIAIFALLCLPVGGGFYLGTILGFIGGLTYYEWPKSLSETFLGKILRAAKGDSKFFAEVCGEQKDLSIAALTVIFTGLLSGLGDGLYAYNADVIRKEGSLAFKILAEGYVLWNEIILFSAISIIGMTMMKWLIFSACIYWIGAKLVGLPCSYDKVLRGVAYALVPEGIMVFMPLLFANEPTLTFNWPVGLYLTSRVWVFICLLIAARQMFDFSLTRAFGVVLLGGTIYWLIYHEFMVPTLNIPGFRINISMPESSIALLTLIGVISLIATATGVFSRKRIA